MASIADKVIMLRKILYLTDFSGCSESALPFVISIARNYEAKVSALHVLIPAQATDPRAKSGEAAIAADEEFAESEMQKLDSELSGVPHETNVEWGADIWSVVERNIVEGHSDFVVVGTHGRTGTQRVLLGSVAEEIFRRSAAPVLTIGPRVTGGSHHDGRFGNILLATDFGIETHAASRYAISLAQENQARLTLLHVIRGPLRRNGRLPPQSAAEILHSLMEIVTPEAQLWCQPEAVVEYGEPAKAILHAAKTRGVDLIVLGLHSSVPAAGAETRQLRATAHKVVAHSHCPVLTARS
jgi:nucleotide-binding universal stress UspA family protein